MDSLVFVFHRLYFVPDVLDFTRPSVAHSLHSGVLADEFFDFHVGLLQLDPEAVYFFLEVDHSIFVDVGLDSGIGEGIPLLFFASVLFVEEEGVFVFEVDDEVIEFEEVGFEFAELVELIFEMVDEDILLVVFGLGGMLGSDGGLGVVQVLAVHFFINKNYYLLFVNFNIPN